MSFSPAYHLRTNKGVERLLFLELLRKLDGKLPTPVMNYEYVGMGGPYLEDFAAIHGMFGNLRMTSLEIHKHVRTRQAINRPNSRVYLTPYSTADFVASYKPRRWPLLGWFDYEWPDWMKQISESCDLLRQLPELSIFKITLSGRTDWLDEGAARDPMVFRAEKLSAMFADYGTFAADRVNRDSICDTLYSIFRRAVADAVPDTSQRRARSLASYRYDDGTPILTVTLILGPPDKLNRVISGAKLEDWPFADLNWGGAKQLAVPNLSIREKLAVDSMLPDAATKTVLSKLKLRLSGDYGECVRAMENYVQLYRHVPAFVRVTI